MRDRPDIAQSVRGELERVLSSSEFARTERQARLLRFLVSQRLDGREAELKESTIAVEVFGRRPDYDPKQDSTVRTEASRLRARLNKYYADEGSDDPLVIELPKGSYRPVFNFREAEIGARRPLPSRFAAILAIVALVAAATVWWWIQHRRAPIPIAVLPLISLSPDSHNDYFADALTGEIIRNLSIIDGLAVRSQTSSMAFKGKPRNVRVAGKQLTADYLLEGSVLRAGQQLRINAQLVRVRDDFPVWSDRYDRDLTDVFAIQDEISRAIVNSLRLRIGRGQRRYETSVEAYDLYLHARSFEMLPAGTGVARSVGPFEQAIARDPVFAPAYAGLAAARAALLGFDEFDPVSRKEMTDKGWSAVEKAIQLDPLLAEAHDALGMMQAREGQWRQAERSFRRALEIASGDPLWHEHFASFLLLPLGRIEEALQQLRIAEKIDPLSPAVHPLLRKALRSAGRFEEAEIDCYKMAVDNQQKSECLAEALLRHGQQHKAIPILEARWSDRLLEPGAQILGVAYAKAGRRDEATRVAATVPRPLSKATVFAALGEKSRALEALEGMVPLGPVRMGRDVLISPAFALLRDDPRLKRLCRKAGLPE